MLPDCTTTVSREFRTPDPVERTNNEPLPAAMVSVPVRLLVPVRAMSCSVVPPLFWIVMFEPVSAEAIVMRELEDEAPSAMLIVPPVSRLIVPPVRV